MLVKKYEEEAHSDMLFRTQTFSYKKIPVELLQGFFFASERLFISYLQR